MINDLEYNTKVDTFSIGIIFSIMLSRFNPLIGSDANETNEKSKKCQIDFENSHY